MGVSEEKIKILNEKVTYYVNPFDIVSMLNRGTGEQIGKVKTIIPLTYGTTLDSGAPAHGFGDMNINENGKILTASEDYHPEYIRAGEKLSRLLDKYRKMLKENYLNQYQCYQKL